MKSTGIITVDVEELLDAYFRLCSIEVNCSDIAAMAATLANEGISPITGKTLFDAKTARIVKGVMTTCGLYDGSGEFAVDVGMPGKSGVGGGIMTVSPDCWALVSWGLPWTRRATAWVVGSFCSHYQKNGT